MIMKIFTNSSLSTAVAVFTRVKILYWCERVNIPILFLLIVLFFHVLLWNFYGFLCSWLTITGNKEYYQSQGILLVTRNITSHKEYYKSQGILQITRNISLRFSEFLEKRKKSKVSQVQYDVFSRFKELTELSEHIHDLNIRDHILFSSFSLLRSLQLEQREKHSY